MNAIFSNALRAGVLSGLLAGLLWTAFAEPDRNEPNGVKVEVAVLDFEQALRCVQQNPAGELPRQGDRRISRPYLVVRILNSRNQSGGGVLRCHIPNLYQPLDLPIRALPPNSKEWDWYLVSLGATAMPGDSTPVSVRYEWKKLRLQ